MFLVTLGGVPAVVLSILNLGLAYNFIDNARYFWPCYLAIELSFAYLFAAKLSDTSISKLRWVTWWLTFFAVILLSIISCAVISQAKSSRQKLPFIYKHTSDIAQIINQSSQPLVISNERILYLFAIGYLLDQKMQFQLVDISNLPGIPSGFSDVFLYSTKEILEREYAKMYEIECVYHPLLWRIKNKKFP